MLALGTILIILLIQMLTLTDYKPRGRRSAAFEDRGRRLVPVSGPILAVLGPPSHAYTREGFERAGPEGGKWHLNRLLTLCSCDGVSEGRCVPTA